MTEPGPATGRAAKSYVFLVAFVAAIGGFLFGFDLNIIGSGMAYITPQFDLDDAADGFARSSALLGCIVGPFLGIWLGDRLGRKNCLYVAAALFFISAIGTALPQNITQFNIFRIVGGLGIGFSSMIAPMYIAEISPARKRGCLVLMYQLAITLGGFLGVVLAWQLASDDPMHPTCWRWMFGLEAVPVVVFVAFLAMVPRSPRWLMETNRREEALEILTRINGREQGAAEMENIASSIAEETGTFGELFRKGMCYALLIAVLLALFNNLTGWSMTAYYMPALFQKAGWPNPADAIGQSVILNIFNVALTCLAIALVDRVGRRKLWILGSAAMILSTLFSGLLFQLGASGPIVVVGLIAVNIPHAVALGPLPWLMISELFPTRIRAKAVGIATTCVWIAAYAGTQLFGMLDGALGEAGLAGGSYWAFTLICVFSLIFGIKMLPETKGKTLEEIARFWKRS